MIQKDLQGSEKILETGIKILQASVSETSEQLALLALMESFSIQYAPGMEAVSIASRSVKHAEEAVQLDSTNLRAYYVLGSNDFYTPEQYGGGKKAEWYLKKAVSLPDQSIRNPYLPSWGKNSAYEMLIRFYIRQHQYDQAKVFYQQAIALFPNDYMINQLAGALTNQ
jgi:tetratricopeptide (TPR) repeat protein